MRILFIGLCLFCFSLPSVYGNYKVIFFLSETCPICQKSTPEIRAVYEAYKDRGIEFVALFPNAVSSDSSIAAFGRTYLLEFELRRDVKQEYARELGATKTPEVFVVDKNNKVVYRGGIDNAFASLGKQRRSGMKKYLFDALHALTAQKEVARLKTPAIGCFIEFEKL